MRIVRFTPEAAQDIEEAMLWYETESHGLGAKFLNVVESGLALLKEDSPPLLPVQGNAFKLGVKKLLLHRFPYVIIVLPKDTEIIVIAVAHQRRRPKYWSKRI